MTCARLDDERPPRVAYAVGRRVGGAVARNRCAAACAPSSATRPRVARAVVRVPRRRGAGRARRHRTANFAPRSARSSRSRCRRTAVSDASMSRAGPAGGRSEAIKLYQHADCPPAVAVPLHPVVLRVRPRSRRGPRRAAGRRARGRGASGRCHPFGGFGFDPVPPPRAPEGRSMNPLEPFEIAHRLAARRLLLGRPESRRRDHPAHLRGDGRAAAAHREADALDDRDAAHPARDQEDPGAVQGRQQKQNEALMEFYKENNVNPLSGCLPLIVQMPVLFALFQVLRDDPGPHPDDGPVQRPLPRPVRQREHRGGVRATRSTCTSSGLTS